MTSLAARLHVLPCSWLEPGQSESTMDVGRPPHQGREQRFQWGQGVSGCTLITAVQR